MKTSAQIREEMGRQIDRAQAINDIASAREGGEHTAEEKAELDKILGSGKKGEKDFKAGIIGGLEEDLERAEKFEARLNQLSAKREGGKPGLQSGDGNADEDADESTVRLAKVRVPATASYRHGGLRAFQASLYGNSHANAEKAAYVTGQFLLATIGRSERAGQWCKDNGIDLRFRGALKEGDNSLGGFVVPTEMERSIINLREERGVLRREAQVVPMSSDTMSLPRRAGGITVYFVGENTAGTASDPTLDQVLLSVKKAMAYTTMSSEVSEDAVISMADWVSSEIAYGFADKEDQCGFNGTGASTYGGMQGLITALAAGSIYTAATGHTAYSTLTLADFHGVTAMLPLYAQQNAKWYISKAGFSASMERLMAAGGGNTWQTLSNGQSTPKFLGYDVVFTQVMNSTLTAQTSTAGLAYFGDMRQGVKLGSRRGLAIDTSKDFLFSSDSIAIKGTERFDVVVHEKGTASAAGSLIGLSTPAS